MKHRRFPVPNRGTRKCLSRERQYRVIEEMNGKEEPL